MKISEKAQSFGGEQLNSIIPISFFTFSSGLHFHQFLGTVWQEAYATNFDYNFHFRHYSHYYLNSELQAVPVLEDGTTIWIFDNNPQHL